MGVFIGVLVLLLSISLVVLLALSEWYDFDLGASTRQAVATVIPAMAEAPVGRSAKAAKAKAKAAPARRRAVAKKR